MTKITSDDFESKEFQYLAGWALNILYEASGKEDKESSRLLNSVIPTLSYINSTLSINRHLAKRVPLIDLFKLQIFLSQIDNEICKIRNTTYIISESSGIGSSAIYPRGF